MTPAFILVFIIIAVVFCLCMSFLYEPIGNFILKFFKSFRSDNESESNGKKSGDRSN